MIHIVKLSEFKFRRRELYKVLQHYCLLHFCAGLLKVPETHLYVISAEQPDATSGIQGLFLHAHFWIKIHVRIPYNKHNKQVHMKFNVTQNNIGCQGCILKFHQSTACTQLEKPRQCRSSIQKMCRLSYWETRVTYALTSAFNNTARAWFVRYKMWGAIQFCWTCLYVASQLVMFWIAPNAIQINIIIQAGRITELWCTNKVCLPVSASHRRLSSESQSLASYAASSL